MHKNTLNITKRSQTMVNNLDKISFQAIGEQELIA